MRVAYPNELYHHGIKGQRGGVRRFQNKDGSLTKAGKDRQRIRDKARRRAIMHQTTLKDVEEIISSLSLHEKKLVMDEEATKDTPWIDPKQSHAIQTNIAKRIIQKHNNVPMSFIEVWDNGGDVGHIAIATRRDSNARGKGYATKNVEQMLRWYDRYGKNYIDHLEWNADRTNLPSIGLAKKFGFTEITKEQSNRENPNFNYEKYIPLRYYPKS